MKKFESSLLQVLSSIDESLKTIAGGKQPVAEKQPAKPATRQPAKPAAKKAGKAGNGKVPKAVSKTVKSLKAATARPAPGKSA